MQEFSAAIQAAMADHTALNIVGGNSKEFLGRTPQGMRLDTATHRGILHYEPSELVVTARAGTPLRELEQALAEHGQMLLEMQRCRFPSRRFTLLFSECFVCLGQSPSSAFALGTPNIRFKEALAVGLKCRFPAVSTR